MKNGTYVCRLATIPDAKLVEGDPLSNVDYELLRPYLRVLNTYNFVEYHAEVDEAKERYLSTCRKGLASVDPSKDWDDPEVFFSRVKPIFQDVVQGIEPISGETQDAQVRLDRITSFEALPTRIAIWSSEIHRIVSSIDPALLTELSVSVIPRSIQTYLNNPGLLKNYTAENITEFIGLKSLDGMRPVFADALYELLTHVDEFLKGERVVAPYRAPDGSYPLVFMSINTIQDRTNSDIGDNDPTTKHAVLTLTHVGNLIPELNDPDRTEHTLAEKESWDAGAPKPVALGRKLAELQFLWMPDKADEDITGG